MPSPTDQNALPTGARYEVYEELARGGMGSIHRARDRFTSRLVAYKRMAVANEAARSRAVALFRREYETLARLPHPNIVRVYDYGIDSHGPFYVMELLSGDDLTKVAPLEIDRACSVLRDIASALALVHARRLVHRDVSPSNVRLTSEGRAKLLDFGALTPFGRARELVGTPLCIAPECLWSGSLDQRVDLYALGAVAYWILTKRTHLRASTVEELERALQEPIVRPSAHRTDLPAELDDLVMALLAREPLARPESAAVVIERLSVIGDLPSEGDGRAVAFSYLARPPLVARNDVLATAKEHIDAALRGRSANLLIEADRGLGRSAVLEDAAFHAQSTGATVVRLRGDVAGEAFSSVRTLIENLVALDPELRNVTDARESRPSLTSIGGPSRVDSALQVAERHAAILRAAESTVVEAARRAPVILFVDDLDQLDDASASLFASLASRDGQRSMAIIASARMPQDDAGSPALRMFRSNAACRGLAPLSVDDLAVLTRSVFGAVPNVTGFAKWLHAQSGGRPALAMDVARLLLDQGTIAYTRGTFTLPQDATREVVAASQSRASLSRLGAVGADAKAVAVALALHGHSLSVRELEAALQVPLAQIILGVEELDRAGVVVSAEERVHLGSSALSAALVSRLTEEEARALHARIAEALFASAVKPETALAASSHFLKAGMEQRAIDAMAAIQQQEFVPGPVYVPWVGTMEALLEIYKRQGRRKEECLKLMVQIVNAGFYGELAAQTRHIDLALEWMSLVCGMSTATRLRPFVGPKLALAFGLIYAALRRAFTPKSARIGALPEMLDMLSRLVSVAVAAAASALDTSTALRAASYLEPFAVLPPHTAGALLREFSMATCELTTGQVDVALQRYERLLLVFSEPVKGLHEDARRQLCLGCLNGLAQGGLWRTSPRVLEVAEQLASDAFFAPHAECARMFYHAYRGEHSLAEEFRSRVELAALQGGTSWSALGLVAAHAGVAAMRTRDHVALIHAISEQRRLASLAPSLSLTPISVKHGSSICVATRTSPSASMRRSCLAPKCDRASDGQ